MLALLKHIPHHPVHDRLKIIQLLVDEDEKQNLKVKVCVSLCLLPALYLPHSVCVLCVLYLSISLSDSVSVSLCIYLSMSHSFSLSFSLSLSHSLSLSC